MPSAPTVLPRPDRAAPVPAGRPAAPALPGPGSRPGHPDRSRHQFVGHLLDGTCRTGDVPRIAARLGLPVHGRYTVVALAGGSAAARIAARTLVEGPAHWHTTASGAYGIVGGTAPLRPDPLPPGIRLGCHRNTVTNRLHRIERLTGHRVDRPRDVVELALALARARSGPLPPAAATTGP
jgi:hypothetical protein